MGNNYSLIFYRADTKTILQLPYHKDGVRAGFPSPATDYIDSTIDLNQALIKNPASTFFAKVVGDSMSNEDILDGDIIIVDKSLEVMDGDLAVCYIDGEFTLKRVEIGKDIIWLVPSNPKYPKFKVTPDDDFTIWGIVTYTIKKNRRKR